MERGIPIHISSGTAIQPSETALAVPKQPLRDGEGGFLAQVSSNPFFTAVKYHSISLSNAYLLISYSGFRFGWVWRGARSCAERLTQWGKFA